MTIIDGVVDWAQHRPGPALKVFPAINQMSGLVCHSAEGYNASNFRELDNPARQASWHFTNALDGTFYQHYPITASCWTSGNYEANTRYFAVESEGQASVDGPLNDAQVRNLMRLAADLVPVGVTLTRAGARTLWEHSEVATRWSPNAGPTACPSHRYDPFFAALEGGMDMADPRVDALLRALYAGSEATADDGTLLSETDRLALAIYRMEQADAGQEQSVAEQAASAKANLASHIDNHAAEMTGMVADHKHEPGKVTR